MTDSLREKIAAVQHEIWSHWMRYLFTVTIATKAGEEIPLSYVARWERQMETVYKDLTEKEKESDRHQADKVLEVIRREIK